MSLARRWRSLLAGPVMATLVLSAVAHGLVSCGRSTGGARQRGPASGAGGALYFASDGSLIPPHCDGSLPKAEAPDARPGCDAGSPVSYQQDIAPIIGTCTGEICHGGWSYETVVGRPSRECCDQFLVSPGDPSKSYLLNKLEGKNICWGSRMPLDPSPLATASIQKIADWICQGAPHN